MSTAKSKAVSAAPVTGAVEHTITLKTSQLRDLVTPVLPFVDTTIPVLGAVLISAHGPYLFAMSTDRYRVAAQRLRVDGDIPQGFEVLIHSSTLRGILNLHRASRGMDPELVLTFAGDRVRVETGGALDPQGAFAGFMDSRTTWPTQPGEYPKLRSIWAQTFARVRTGEMAPAAFNSKFLADFAKCLPAGEPNTPMQLWTDTTRAALIRIGQDFVAALMPVRFGGDLLAAAFDDAWTGALGLNEPETVTAVKADACANPIGCDRPGTEDMGDGKKFCPECCSPSQGSGYDDRVDQ